jgi:hypothetical protein
MHSLPLQTKRVPIGKDAKIVLMLQIPRLSQTVEVGKHQADGCSECSHKESEADHHFVYLTLHGEFAMSPL